MAPRSVWASTGATSKMQKMACRIASPLNWDSLFGFSFRSVYNQPYACFSRWPCGAGHRFLWPAQGQTIRERIKATNSLIKSPKLSSTTRIFERMPLPSDDKIIQLANDLLAQFDGIYGLYPGFRPVHAKGIMLTGAFTPSPDAASLTRALHVLRDSTSVTVRFSNSTGLPLIPDNDPNSNPRGLALRFHLADHVHTDILSHSTDGFPTSTGQEFLDFLRAVAAGDPSAFLATHPAALAFVQTPKPSPFSFATEAYFGVTAFRFFNKDGLARYGRYRIVP